MLCRIAIAVAMATAAWGCGSGGGGGNGTDADSDADSVTDGDPGDAPDTGGDPYTDPDVDTNRMLPTDFCNEAGWCWENPLPHGNTIRSVRVMGPDDVWFGTDGGHVLRFYGSSWYGWYSGMSTDMFHALWGTGPEDMYALGNSTLYRYDGDDWAAILNQSGMTDLAGFADDDIWISGYGMIRHWNGTSWETHDVGTASLVAIHGNAPDDVWAVGLAGAVMRWNGLEWEDHAQDPALNFTDVWGSASDDVYLTTSGSAVLRHWDGSAFEDVDPGLASGWVAISGTARDDVWVVGGTNVVGHYDGLFWNNETLDSPMWGTTAIHTTPDAGPWAVGMYGRMCEREGGAWSCSESLTYDTIMSLWGTSAGSMTAMGMYGPIASRDASGWTAETTTSPDYMNEVWQTGEDEAWGYRQDWSSTEYQLRFYRWDGATWNEEPLEVPRLVRDVWVSDDGRAWAVGEGGTACLFDGASWSCGPTGTTGTLYAVWGVSATDVWAVGENGAVTHWNGTGWTPASSGTSYDLYSVWGADSNDVWAVSDIGGVLHYDGSWALDPAMGAYGLQDIFGLGTDDVWVVGQSGQAWHWNGLAWTEVETGIWDRLYSVWGAATDDVWAVGEHGAIIHWNGLVWAEDTSIDDWYMLGVGGTGADDVWIVADYGGMYHNTGSGWVAATNRLTEEGVGMRHIFGTSTGDLWVVDTDGRAHSRDGDLWSAHGFLEERDAVIADVAAAGPDDAWAAVAEGLLLHWDGEAWRLFDSRGARRMDAVHVAGPGAAWAVGDVLVGWDGTSWERLAEISGLGEDARFVGVFGGPGPQVRMLLGTGVLYEWDGTSVDPLFAVSGWVSYQDAYFVSIDELWAVGMNGAMLAWDGSAVRTPSSITANTLTTVFATPDGHVFAGGGAGTILHKGP